ncbi:MAG: hypothetical protein V9G19_11260 [Tetrasphaera sp.]
MAIQITAVATVALGFWRRSAKVASLGLVDALSQVCHISEKFMLSLRLLLFARPLAADDCPKRHTENDPDHDSDDDVVDGDPDGDAHSHPDAQADADGAALDIGRWFVGGRLAG